MRPHHTLAPGAGLPAGGTAAPPPGQRSLALLRVVLAVFAVTVAVQAALGFAGVLHAAPLALAVLGTSALAISIARRRRERTVDGAAARAGAPPWTAADCAGLAALLAAACDRLWSGLHRTTFLYDVLSYHLHIPAAWRAADRLQVVPTPFGDPSPAYSPSNAELVYHLLLSATGNARLAHAGQLPFAALAALAIYTTARLMAAPRAVGFGAALAFLLIPEIWQQAPTAMVDLGTAAFFLSAVPFLLRLEFRGAVHEARRALVGLALALGLLLGTKYLAVVLCPPLLAWLLVIGVAAVRRRRGASRPSPRAVAAGLCLLSGVVLCSGGFWYLRNALVTGNPMFPATLHLGRWTLAPGLFDGARARSSPYHLPIGEFQALLEIIADNGWGFWLAVAITMALALGLALAGPRGAAAAEPPARLRRWLMGAASLLALVWVVAPYQESRFFFPCWGVLAMAMATGQAHPRARGAALLAATVGSVLQFPTPGRLAVVVVAAAAALCGPPTLARLRLGGGRRWTTAAPAVRAALLAAAVAVAVTWGRTHPPLAPYTVGDAHDQAWEWMVRHQARLSLGRAPDHQAGGLRIAYTGSNLPFPLWGARLQNDVRYVSVAGGPFSAAPHHFLAVPPAALTMASAEAAPEREVPVLSLWRSNLDTLGIDLLFVAALVPHLQPIIGHDDDGFPIERTWADADPRRFPLLFANDGVRIYGCHAERRP